MNARTMITATLLALAPVSAAGAQSAAFSEALANGEIGEQADGYMGVRGTVSGPVRAEVEALNIKRREAYTALAGQRGVTVREMAGTTGCVTLRTRVAPGRAYLLRDGIWRVRQGNAPIELPDYCPQ